MTVSHQPRSGYTLPVFATAAAIAALRWLQQNPAQEITESLNNSVQVDLIEPAQTVKIPIEQVGGIKDGMALAIALSDPGDNLDLTRNTPVWALVELRQQVSNGAEEQVGRGAGEQVGRGVEGLVSRGAGEQIMIQGGEGIGRIVNADGQAAIYTYAQRLLRENLGRLLKPEENIQVTIILPEGRQLAQRTSNAAFGVVEGLSLLGTSGISQPLSAPGQLDASLEELQKKAKLCREVKETKGLGEDSATFSPAHQPALVFCVGENGLDLARQMGINPEQVVKTANWLGPMLVEAGIQKVPAILLFGYHGKLMKLAGGIFHTHHYLADGRLEILTAHCAQLGLPTPNLQSVFASATAEDALKYLRQLDAATGSDWVEQVYCAIAQTIDRRTEAYIRTHSEQDVRVGSVLFDRSRQIIVKSQTGAALLSYLC